MSQLLLGSTHLTFLPSIILLFLQWKNEGSQEEAALAGNSVCVGWGGEGGGGHGVEGFGVKSSARIETSFRGLNHLLQI